MNRLVHNFFPIQFRSHPRARRYTLRLDREGDIVVTMPRGASQREAMQFVNRHRGWLSEQRAKRADSAGHANEWHAGMRILFRGEEVELRIEHLHGRPLVAFADQRVFIADASMNLRRPVEAHLVAFARVELAMRTRELSDRFAIAIMRATVRNQSSRWGSCSESGEISLNWRLVQAPAGVRDYLIIHELMHRREMNHSIRFWRHVAAACPDWRAAEMWLNAHAVDLGF
ncbi:MAG: M48 family metallopeptidase [Opitutaceae bacterium]